MRAGEFTTARLTNVSPAVLESLSVRSAVLFVGAGLSKGAGLPLFSELVEPWRKELGLRATHPLEAVADLYRRERGGHAVLKYLREVLRTPAAPDLSNQLRVLALGCRWIVTTNYDGLLEEAFRRRGDPVHRILGPKNLPHANEAAEVQLVKLHGDLETLDRLVLTASDYSDFFERNRGMVTRLSSLMQCRPFVFVGYSLGDPNIRNLLRKVRQDLQAEPPRSCIVAFDPDKLDIEDWHSLGVDTVALPNGGDRSAVLGRFIEELGAEIEAARQRALVPPAAEAAAASHASSASAKASPPLGGLPRALAQAYLTGLVSKLGTVALRGIAASRDVLRLKLEEIYVPLKAAPPPRLMPKRDSSPEGAGKASKPKPMEEFLSPCSHLVVTGDPGSGKTTFLSWIACGLAKAHLAAGPAPLASPLLNWDAAHPVPFPIWLPLGECSRYLQARQTTDPSLSLNRASRVKEFLARELSDAASSPVTVEALDNALCQGNPILLADGLDEVSGENARQAMREALDELVAALRGCRAVVTCRTRAYTPRAQLGAEFDRVTVLPLDEKAIESFAAQWGLALAQMAGTGGNGESEAGELMRAVQSSERVRTEFAPSPLLLTAVAIVQHHRKRLPEQRVELFDVCVDTLLEGVDLAKPGASGEELTRLRVQGRVLSLTQKRRLLEPIALDLHRRGDARQAPTDEVIEQVRKILQSDFGPVDRKDAENAVEHLELRSGLVVKMEDGRGTGFRHLGFQEFLAAAALRAEHRTPDAIWGAVAVDLLEPWWREVMLLLPPLMGLRGDSAAARDLVSRVANTAGMGPDEELHRLELAALALVDLKPYAGAPELEPRLIEQLVRSIESGNGSLRARVDAAGALGRLGDPGLARADRLVEIPPGKFWRGNEAKLALPDEKPLRQIELTRPYALDRYPVTNEDYGKFVAARGYAELQFWSKEGWEWRQQNKVTEPEEWRDSHWNGPSSPVVGVSWFEAEAYCQWRTEAEKSEQQPYRLPTEAEWERGARGDRDSRDWPWGPEWEDCRANTAKCGLDRTSPVGAFGAGASPWGLLDMAGNVWEWCSDWYAGDFYAKSAAQDPEGPTQGSRRVVRGGSWSRASGVARCSRRSRNVPRSRNISIGFRCARSI